MTVAAIAVAMEDRLAIERQLYEYSYAYDARDVDGWLAVFTSDAVGDAIMVGATEPFMRMQGQTELRAFVERGIGREGHLLHHVSGLVFDEASADSAVTRSMVHVTLQIPELAEPVTLTHGIYHDRWVKAPDGWRIQHRRYVAYGYRRLEATESQSES